MGESIAAFETELINKIQFKTSSKVSSDAFLFKAFKFFDLYNNGWLSRLDFFKAIAKCGVVVDTHDMDAIYNYYGGAEGKLSYKQFIEHLLFKEQQPQETVQELRQSKMKSSAVSQAPSEHLSNPEQRPSSSRSRQPVEDPREKLKESNIQQIYRCETLEDIHDCIKRNLRRERFVGLLEIAVQIKNSDIRKVRVLPRAQFKPYFGYLSDANLQALIRDINPKSSEEVNFAELIYKIKGQLDGNVERAIGEIFGVLNVERNGEVPISLLINRNAERSDIDKFRTAVDLYCQFQGITDGIFTDEDFLDFFGFLAVSADEPSHFIQYLNAAYLDQDNRSVHSVRSNRSRDFQDRGSKKQIGKEEKANVLDFRKNKQVETLEYREEPAKEHVGSQMSNHDELERKSRYSQMEKKEPSNFARDVEQILLRVKRRLASKGTRGFLLFEKAMKNADLDRDSLVNFEEFKQVIKDQRIDITPTQCNTLFDLFDEQGTGYLNYNEFIFTLRGNIPESRLIYLQKLWPSLRLPNVEATTFAHIKHHLCFKAHPDIQNGRRFEQDIFKEIQETILIIQDLNGNPRNEMISRAEFDEYMQNFSLSITDEKLYESILVNFWKVNMALNIQDMYAGSRKMFDPTKNGYQMDHHRSMVKGGSVSQNAPFGTSVEPTNYFTENKKL